MTNTDEGRWLEGLDAHAELGPEHRDSVEADGGDQTPTGPTSEASNGSGGGVEAMDMSDKLTQDAVAALDVYVARQRALRIARSGASDQPLGEPLTAAIGFGFRAGRAFEQETQVIAGLAETLSREADEALDEPCPKCNWRHLRSYSDCGPRPSEREVIVAFLRKWVQDDPACQATLDPFGYGAGVLYAATRIERGDHRSTP